ncbi:MAG: hypothetical protein LBL15_01695 [Oscillospiraceae bacterium]|jgi:hypothetical protein|nr:hypothetical protein [Oscillospiraceae bacterium]
MKRKTRNILLGTVIPALLIGGVIYCLNDPADTVKADNKPEAVASSASVQPAAQADWKNHFEGLTGMLKGTDLVIKGKVVDAYTEQRVDMVFTKQVIEIEKAYGGSIKAGDRITLLQTGGERNGIYTRPFDEDPLLN